jgi:hypothetical protein
MLKRIAIVVLVVSLMFASFILGNLTATPETIHDAKPTIERIKPEPFKPSLPETVKS